MVRETVKAYTTRLPAPGGFPTIPILSISILIILSITILSISILSIIRWIAKDKKTRHQT